ncbi:MAG: BlaI/MecI/CopY family transcriptional regulator [Pseudohongiellaceae bacterium]
MTRYKEGLTGKTPLSRAQREVMEIVWDKEEVSVLEVTDLLNLQRPVARNTVRTLMERMHEKGWLTYRAEGRSYIYSALIPREESLGQRVSEMVDKACGGEPEKLMVALLNYRGLSDEETKRIQLLLNEAKLKAPKKK